MENKKNDPIWRHNNVALILIDYQPEMFDKVKSIDTKLMELHVRYLVKAAKALNIPIIPSTVAVNLGINEPTLPSIQKEIGDVPTIDRTTMNAWDDENFVKAVEATGKNRLIYLGLWTEICLTFPVVHSMSDGYETMFVADAVGGTTVLDHETGIQRMIQAGAVPSTFLAIIAELFTDWATPEGAIMKPIITSYYEELAKLQQQN